MDEVLGKGGGVGGWEEGLEEKYQDQCPVDHCTQHHMCLQENRDLSGRQLSSKPSDLYELTFSCPKVVIAHMLPLHDMVIERPHGYKNYLRIKENYICEEGSSPTQTTEHSETLLAEPMFGSQNLGVSKDKCSLSC